MPHAALRRSRLPLRHAPSSPCVASRGGNPASAQQDRPERAEDQERPERDIRPPADPPEHEQHARARARPAISPASSPAVPESSPSISPTPTSSFTSPIPNAPAPNGIDSRYSTAGTTTATSDRGDQPAADQRVLAGHVEEQGERDDRQRQVIGQQPLVEVHREAPRRGDANHAPNSARATTGASAEPQRQQRRTRTRRSAPRRRFASRSVGRPAFLLVVLRPAGRDPVGDDAPSTSPATPRSAATRGSASGARVASAALWPPASASSTSVAWRHAGRAARRVRHRPCGSSPSRRCRGGPTAWSRTRAGRCRS